MNYGPLVGLWAGLFCDYNAGAGSQLSRVNYLKDKEIQSLANPSSGELARLVIRKGPPGWAQVAFAEQHPLAGGQPVPRSLDRAVPDARSAGAP